MMNTAEKVREARRMLIHCGGLKSAKEAVELAKLCLEADKVLDIRLELKILHMLFRRPQRF